ncbi:photosystem I reaction centre subunit XII [Synechococcus sp. WH 8101]|jgi:photosystem I subunit 12|nr:photosystem I reaction centre subunit XII [Synechococcus sp. WH 8101]
MMASALELGEQWWCFSLDVMASSLTQAEVLIALVVAAHAGVLAVRLCVSLYRA